MLSISAKELTLVRSPLVLKIRDVYPGSRIRMIYIPDTGSDFFPSRIPDPHQIFEYFNPKKLVSKLSEIWPGLFITDPSRIQDQKGTGSRIRIRNSAVHFQTNQRTKVDLLCCVDAVRGTIHSAGHCLAAQGGALGLCLDKYNWLAHKW